MNTNTNHSGNYFAPALTLIFITLKLTDVIDWSWWLVLGPMWMPLVFTIVVIGPIWVIYTVKEANREKREADLQADQEAQNAMQGFEEDTRH